MLSMKTLRVAIVTIGAALLLGPGFAAATVQQLDGAAADANMMTYASESLSAGVNNVPATGTATHYGLTSPPSPSNQWIVVRVNGRINADDTASRYRVELGGGMVFNSVLANSASLYVSATSTPTDVITNQADFTDTPPNSLKRRLVSTYADRYLGGRAGDNFIVFGLNCPTTVNANSTSCTEGIKIGEYLWINVVNSLAVPAGEGTYTATASVTGTEGIAGSATIVRVVSGLDASITAAAPAVADVGTGFLQFLGATAEGESVARLGMFHARANASLTGLLAADDGEAADNGDILKAGATAVGLTVNGDLSIGAFKIAADTHAAGSTAPNMSNCPDSVATASPTKKTKSDLTVAEGATEEGTASRAAGAYELCVDVNDDGANETAIEAGKYTASLMVTGPGAAATPMTVLEDMAIGSIVRNGSSVRVTYLTVNEKYNQRLIIVNRSSRDVEYTLGQFVTEDGTEVEGTDMATGMVGANSQVVMKVRDLLSFTDLATIVDSTGSMREVPPRTAATVTANAPSGMLAVATTQVNLEDGSTDTVLYEIQAQ